MSDLRPPTPSERSSIEAKEREELARLMAKHYPGWKLVPVEPTPAILQAWLDYYSDPDDESGFSIQAEAIWELMLAAAPALPSPPSGKKE